MEIEEEDNLVDKIDHSIGKVVTQTQDLEEIEKDINQEIENFKIEDKRNSNNSHKLKIEKNTQFN